MSFIKEIILQFDAQLKGDGLPKVKQQLTDIDKEADKSFTNIQKNLKEYENSLQSASNKKLDLKGVDELIKKLKQAEKEANDLEKDFNKLSESQRIAAVKAKTAIQDQIKTLNQQRSKIIETGQSQAVSTRLFSNALNSLIPILGNYGQGVSNAVSSVQEYIEASGEAGKSSTRLGSALQALKNPYVAVGAAIAAVITLPIVGYFTQTGEGADKLAIAIDRAKLTFGRFGFEVGQVGESFLNGNFRQGLTQLREALKEFFGFGKNGELKQAIAKEVQDFEDFTRKVNLENAKADIRVSEARAKLFEQAKNVKELNEQKKAFNVLETDGLTIAKNKEVLAKRALDNEIRRQDFISKGQRSKLKDAELDRLNALEIAYDQAKASTADFNRFLVRERNKLNSEQKRLDNEEAESNKATLEALQKINDQLKKLADSSNDVNFTNRVGELFNLPKEFTSGELPENSPFTNLFDHLEAQRLKLLQSLEKMRTSLESAFKELPFGTEPPDTYIEALNNIAKAEEAIDKAFIKAVTIPTVREPIKLKLEIDTSEVEKAKTSGAFNFDNLIADIKEGLQQLNKLFPAISEFEEIENKKTDILIEQQKKRVDSALKIASEGNAEQLQLEEERLNKLLQKREEAARRQAQLNAIEKISSTGLAIANFVGGAAKAFKDNPFAAIIEIGALVASVIAGVAALKNASGFYHGTESISKGSSAKRHPQDTIPVYLAEGERVVPNYINDKLKGIPNNKLPELARLYRDNRFNIQSSGSVADIATIEALTRQTDLIEQTKDTLKELSINVGFDGEQFYVKQRLKSRNRQRTNNIKR